MKRRISLIIAFALSFLMMFGSIAMAGETKVQITVTALESVELEVVKIPLAETDNPDSPPPPVKVKIQILEGEKPTEEPKTQECIQCPGTTTWGYMRTRSDGTQTCVPGCNK